MSTVQTTSRRWRTGLGALAAAVMLAAVVAAPASAAERQRTDVYTFAGLPDLVDVGNATLTRTDGGISTKLKTTGLPKAPHTLWWAIWNNPEECGGDGCNEGDFGDPDIDVDIGYADGALVGNGGRATFSASLPEGQPLAGFPTEFGITSGSGLIDADSAEVQLVVRSHGPRIPRLLHEMTHTFHAGCDYSVFGGLVPEGSYGTAGPNSCEDLQFAVFN